jgi:hypothetical protein
VYVLQLMFSVACLLLFGIRNEPLAIGSARSAPEMAEVGISSTSSATFGAEPTYVNTYADMLGSFMLTDGGGRVQLVDFKWGVDRDGVLVPAYVIALDEEGNLIERDHRNQVAEVFNAISDMHGFYSRQPGRFIWTERIKLGITADNCVTTLGLDGYMTDGTALQTGVFAVTPDGTPGVACSCVYTLICQEGSCNDQGPHCTGAWRSPSCKCSNGQCGSGAICSCPVDGWCATGGQHCIIDSSGASCSCQ